MRDDTGVLTCDASLRMLGYISHIYGRAERFLSVFDALGIQMQWLYDRSDELKAQALPQTATWALPLWETEYSITPASRDTTLRRAVVLSKLRAFAAANPWALTQRVAAVTGYAARIAENSAANEFTVFVRHCTVNESAVRAAVDEMKPAHLIFKVKCEEIRRAPAAIACAARYGGRRTLLQRT